MLTALLLSLRMLAYLTYAPLLILPEPCHRRKIFCASVVVIRHRSSLHGCSYMKKRDANIHLVFCGGDTQI